MKTILARGAALCALTAALPLAHAQSQPPASPSQSLSLAPVNAGTSADELLRDGDYATTQVSGKIVYEKVSFRPENDGRWHPTGYVPRIAQGSIPGN